MKLLKIIAAWFYRIFSIMLLMVVFFWLVHPLLTRFVIPPLSVHKRVSQYTSGQYKQYEDGEVFANFTESSPLIEKGEIIAFYHVNHWLQDNPIHGKQCDYFALDIQLSQAEYVSEKALQYDNHGKPYNERDYEIWKWSNGEENNAYFLGFCDESCTVKLVLVTEVNARDFAGTGFYLNSEIDWLSPRDKGTE